jgi:hypothetical protein
VIQRVLHRRRLFGLTLNCERDGDAGAPPEADLAELECSCAQMEGMSCLAGSLRRGASAFVARPDSSTRGGRRAPLEEPVAGGGREARRWGNRGEKVLGGREDRERK